MIILILLLGLGLRLISLDQSLWLDEATSILAARNLSFLQIVGAFSPGDFHPPFYYLLLKIWVSVFGASEAVSRILSVLFGVGTVYLVYLIGCRFFSKNIGVVGGLFLATAPLHVYYSQEARMYVPAAFFTALSAYFFLRLFEEKAKIVSWLAFVLSVVLLLYTDYLPIFFVFALLVYAVVFERTHLTRYAKQWVLVTISLLLAYTPWLPTLFRQLQTGLLVKEGAPVWWQVLGRTSAKQVLLVPLKFTIGRISIYDKTLYALVVAVPLLFNGFLLLTALRFWKDTKFLWIWFSVPAIAATIVGLKLSVFSYFRLLFILPAFYLLLAWSALSFKRYQQLVITGVLVINLISTGIYLFNPRFHREDWRGAVSWVEQQPIGKTAASIFVTKNQRDPYFYYAKRIPAYGPEGLEQGNFDTIYLFRYVQPIFDPQDRVREKIEQVGYKKDEEHDSGGIVVWKYTK